jgi:hypothetical protein
VLEGTAAGSTPTGAIFGAIFSIDLAAGVAELVDALDLGSSDENRGGSNPSARTSAAV